jgi:hypothetical protein
MQSAGLLILCHTREETTKGSTKIPLDLIVEGGIIRKIQLIDFIVRAVRRPVKRAVAAHRVFAPEAILTPQGRSHAVAHRGLAG